MSFFGGLQFPQYQSPNATQNAFASSELGMGSGMAGYGGNFTGASGAPVGTNIGIAQGYGSPYGGMYGGGQPSLNLFSLMQQLSSMGYGQPQQPGGGYGGGQNSFPGNGMPWQPAQPANGWATPQQTNFGGDMPPPPALSISGAPANDMQAPSWGSDPNGGSMGGTSPWPGSPIHAGDMRQQQYISESPFMSGFPSSWGQPNYSGYRPSETISPVAPQAMLTPSPVTQNGPTSSPRWSESKIAQ